MDEKKWKCQEEIAPAKRRHGEMRYAQAKMRHTMQWKSYERKGTAEAKPRNGESCSGTQRNRYEKK